MQITLPAPKHPPIPGINVAEGSADYSAEHPSADDLEALYASDWYPDNARGELREYIDIFRQQNGA